MADRLLGVVLCGGQSSRMGRDKATLLLPDGQSYLDHAVDRLGQLCDQTYLSAQAGRYDICPVIADPDPSFGPISGVSKSLLLAEQHGFHACLFTPVDTPNLTVDELAELVSAFKSTPDRPACAVASETTASASVLNRLEPLIAVYPVSLLPTLLRSIDTRQYSLSRLLRTIDITPVVFDHASCRNVNYPTDITDTER